MISGSVGKDLGLLLTIDSSPVLDLKYEYKIFISEYLV